jgi:hypothetical protein
VEGCIVSGGVGVGHGGTLRGAPKSAVVDPGADSPGAIADQSSPLAGSASPCAPGESARLFETPMTPSAFDPWSEAA